MEEQTRPVAVAAAVLWRGGRFLLCRRPAGKARGLQWEFPGGKLEPGETLRQALARECREELGADVFVGGLFQTLPFRYPDITVTLSFYHCAVNGREPAALEPDALMWVTPAEALDYDLCPADRLAAGQLALQPVVPGSASALLAGRLAELADPAYRAFNLSLIPGVGEEVSLGVHLPDIHRLGRELSGTPLAGAFLAELPHRLLELDQLHGDLLSRMKDFGTLVAALDRFLPYVDNWAVCDSISPKIFARHTEQLYPRLLSWLASGHTYTVRFAVRMLMSFYLGSAYRPEQQLLVASLRSEAYYVRMMAAWYLATALALRYEDAVGILEQRRCDAWTHNRAIQKAVESRRIPEERKQYLRSLRVRLPAAKS